MVTIPKEALEGIRNRETLYGFLKESLGWRVDPEDTFTYQGPQLGGDTAARVEVGQIIPFTGDDPFPIILAEFSEGFRRRDLREVLRAIKADQRTMAKYQGQKPDEFIFICPTDRYRSIRFAHFKEQDKRQPKLSVFGWDADSIDETRTLREYNLPKLTMPGLNVLQVPDWSKGRVDWMAAWNVERVTDAFYKEYDRLFKNAERIVEGITGDDKRLFTQKLFNRLLFIRFLEKKGWLRFGGRRDYLCALWEDYAKHPNEGDFYTARLKLLFFAGLNNPQEADLMAPNGGGLLKDLIGDIPYLNGGLFDEEEDKEQNDTYPDINVPDEALESLVNRLFYDYNFTVTESTPDDVEVAVDPEMLGKVFEELVTGRHESGSYYTPKPVVSFMCREALKGYLRNAVAEESNGAIERFVDLHDPENLGNPESVLDALRVIKVCDPACGSGAYLLGMLHELIDLRGSLFKTKHLDPLTNYEKKLEIIQRNVYGVDIDQFAVNIARLRLWLSLTVEYEGPKPEPLPNLDFKIEKGDSVTVPFSAGGIEVNDMFRRAKIDEFLRIKAEYLTSHGSEKLALRLHVEGLREEIGEWTGCTEVVDVHWTAEEYAELERRAEIERTIPSLLIRKAVGAPGAPFDWMADFAEIFLAGSGFDVVLANPPYIRQELIKHQKPALKKIYDDQFCGTADLYVFFYIRAIQLLKPGGMLVFISSNKWFRARYGETLRRYVAEQTCVNSITDFGELPVFNAATFPMIFIAQKGTSDCRTLFTQVKSLDPPYPNVLAIVQQEGQVLPPDAIKGASWVLTDAASADKLRKMGKAGMPLGEHVNGQMYRGVLTGFNTAFVIDGSKRQELIRKDPKSAEVIRPLVVGDDIRKWHIRPRDRWLIGTRIGVDIKRYPAIFAHLKQWQEELEKRWDKGEHWWELRACAYYDAFDKPKIVFPDIAKKPRFTFDRSGAYLANTAYIIPVDDLFLLGLLNSTPVWRFAEQTFSCLGDPEKGGRFRFIYQSMEKIPIPDASDADKQAISALVQKCLDARGVDCEAWEREIDERVSALYGL